MPAQSQGKRGPGVGGVAKKKGKAFAKRAALFADGDYKEIIEGYLHDRARHFARRKSTAVSGDSECTAEAVLETVAAGALSIAHCRGAHTGGSRCSSASRP